MALLSFDSTNVAFNEGFDPIPAGKYLAMIVDSCWKDTKSGLGRYLELKWQILEGMYAGRNVWERLNLNNPNQQAVDIARTSLSAICHAVGLSVINDSCELHNLPMTISVTCKKAVDSDQITNEIKSHVSRESASVASAASANVNAPSVPPWQR